MAEVVTLADRCCVSESTAGNHVSTLSEPLNTSWVSFALCMHSSLLVTDTVVVISLVSCEWQRTRDIMGVSSDKHSQVTMATDTMENGPVNVLWKNPWIFHGSAKTNRSSLVNIEPYLSRSQYLRGFLQSSVATCSAVSNVSDHWLECVNEFRWMILTSNWVNYSDNLTGREGLNALLWGP